MSTYYAFPFQFKNDYLLPSQKFGIYSFWVDYLIGAHIYVSMFQNIGGIRSQIYPWNLLKKFATFTTSILTFQSNAILGPFVENC